MGGKHTFRALERGRGDDHVHGGAVGLEGAAVGVAVAVEDELPLERSDLHHRSLVDGCCEGQVQRDVASAVRFA